MINGVSCRPFSAKTIPPMIKSGNKEVEEAVIKSSCDLYSRSREEVEREINNWSGMSIGDNINTDGVEKFPAVCSICKKNTQVPFKPESGRPVYCKDCIAKIKSGELKPVAGSVKQIKQDETKFFKPLADLGIEFKQKGGNENGNGNGNGNGGVKRYPERKAKSKFSNLDKKSVSRNSSATTPRVFSGIKKVFTRNKPKTTHTSSRDNTALREILNKTLSDNKILEKKTSDKNIPESELNNEKSMVKPISLNELKTQKSSSLSKSKDRSASPEDMDKLKNFIKKTNIYNQDTPSFKKNETNFPEPTKNISLNNNDLLNSTDKQEQHLASNISQDNNIEDKEEKTEMTTSNNELKSSSDLQSKEVPEDILRKILE